MEFVKHENNMDAWIFRGGKDIKELKQGVISLIIAILSNLRMGSDGLGKRFFQFTHTVNKVLKSGKEQTY